MNRRSGRPARVSARTTNAANARALAAMFAAEPVLRDVAPAGEAVPGFTRNTILTSGPTLDWAQYAGGQRAGIIGGALFEGLAASEDEAARRIAAGEIVVRGCQELGCVGSLAGIYTASMPVFVVGDAATGRTAWCNMFEGRNPRRLNYGVYDDEVRSQLLNIQERVGPVLQQAVRQAGGVPLKPLMVRALHMGDELHSRNTAAALLLVQALVPTLVQLARKADVDAGIQALTEDPYFFLRLSMAAAKVMADAAGGIEGSSMVSAMAFNCREFAIKVSGLGERWVSGSLPTARARFFPGHSEADIAWMGGESPITETVGLGGFAQAAAFPLQAYQGGSPAEMVRRNRSLYRICCGEHRDFRIPFFGFRGTPVGIDIFKVVKTGIRPVMNIGIAGAGGGQIGAGVIEAPLDCFASAVHLFEERYGRKATGRGGIAAAA